MAAGQTHEIPERSAVPESDRWDLSKLFDDSAAWDAGLKEFEDRIPKIQSFKGTLGTSAEHLRKCLDFMNETELLGERLGYYANLRYSEDMGDSSNQERFSRFMAAAAKAEAAGSYQTPEIQAIPDDRMKSFLDAPELAEFVIPLKKILRFKPHILSEREERLLALQIEANQTASKAFGALTDVDIDFGTVDTPEGPRPLTQSTFHSFMISPDREIRREAYTKLYKQYDTHKNTLAALYAGSVQLDRYRAQVRNYPSARAAALFPDDLPESVYDNLVETVGDNLGALHRYYRLKQASLGVKDIRHYDVYVPFVRDIQVKHTYDQAVDVVCEALGTLGDHYCRTMEQGLRGRWVDKYENKGKRSGAFSAGSFAGDPYILMNYKEDVLSDVFTLAHEAGHSMHSWYSADNNPFQYYQYTIFEAEVASTFNEQLLAHHMLERTQDTSMRAYLIGRQLDNAVAVIYRQTMFAEFEAVTHKMVESGTPLTVESLRAEYRKLLEKYFGPDVGLEEVSDLEGLRIPHFYRAFYVYKYSTGLAAAIALADKVMNGGDAERDAYLAFLRSGGSRYPLDSLKLAGVDMREPAPIENALKTFSSMLDELSGLI